MVNKSNNLKRPLYINVYDDLLLRIKQGEYPVGSRLPSEPTLANNLKISRTTLRQALVLLQDDGIVMNIRGKGNYVIDSVYKQDGVQLERLSNPIHKCHTSTFDRIEINYRMDKETEYTKQILKRDSPTVVALERMYKKENALLAYAFTFMPMQTVEEFSLDLNNKDQLFDFLENKVYVHANHGEIKVKFTHKVNLADQNEVLIGQEECFLLTESIYSNADYPLIYNKFYIPQQFSNIKLNSYK